MSTHHSEPSDAGLAAAFNPPEGWLGNPREVNAELRLMLAAVLDIRDKVHADEIPENELWRNVRGAMEATAKIFLGQDPNHVAVVGWNQPGGIDAHVAKVMNLSDTDATDRVMQALWSLAGEICLLVKQEEQGMPEENTRWQMDAAIEQTTKLLMGLPLDKPGPEDA